MGRRPVAKRAVAAGVVALLASACGSPGTASGEQPLAFQSSTTEGAPFDATDLAGQDVVLWFWAPWCTICRAEGPGVAEAAAQVAGSVTVVGVASRGSVDEMRAFIDDTGTGGVTHVADVGGDVFRQFGVVTQPTFVFVDDDGRSQTFAGALSEGDLLEAMRRLADT